MRLISMNGKCLSHVVINLLIYWS